MSTINSRSDLPGPVDPRYVLGQHGTAVPASGTLGEFIRIGGVVDTGTGTFEDGVDVVQKRDRRNWATPHIDAYQLFTTTTAGTQTTTNAGSIDHIGGLREITVLLDVTSTVGSTATLTAYLDTHLGGGGTAWVNIAAFPIVTTAGKSAITLTRSHTTATITTGLAGRVNAGTVTNVGFGDALRLVYTISGATSQFTFSAFFSGIG